MHLYWFSIALRPCHNRKWMIYSSKVIHSFTLKMKKKIINAMIIAIMHMLYSYAGERKRTTCKAYLPMKKDVIPDKAKVAAYSSWPSSRPPVSTSHHCRRPQLTRFYIKFFIHFKIPYVYAWYNVRVGHGPQTKPNWKWFWCITGFWASTLMDLV